MPQEVVRTPVGYKTIETGGAPARAVFPVFDTATNPGPPELSYKVAAGAAAASITILGRNLTGIVSVDVSQDVNVAGNGGTAPVVGAIVVADTSITVPLDASLGAAQDDFWGIFLTDGDGNVYTVPSPLQVVVGGP